ncbi:MAG: Gfo/Idh/MocA family protein [Candidatus Methylomirabilales bacterium]
MGRSRQIRIGVVGFGEWGPNHVRNFSNVSEVKVMGIAEPRAERRQAARQQFKAIRTFENHRELMEAVPLDALVVATPTSTHAQIVRDALEHGLHVLCEKPLCAQVEEGEGLIRLGEEKGLLLMVGHVFLFNAGIVRLRKLLQERELGAVHYLACRRTNLGPIRHDVNAVWDLASHDVSILNYLLNAVPLQVSAVGQPYLRQGLQDVAFITLIYPDGILAHLHVSWLDPVKVREITAVGDRKMATWNDLVPFGPIRIYDKSIIKERHYADFGQFQLLTREGDVTIPRIPMEEPLRVQTCHFLAALKGTEKCLSDGRFALDVVRILSAIDRSMAGGGAPVSVGL